VISLVTVVSLFGWPYSVLLPVFARDVLHVGASGYGYLMAANGVGALVGALALASLGDSPHKRKLFYGGLFGFCIMLGVFALSQVYWLSATALAGSGFFMIISSQPQHRRADARTRRTPRPCHGHLFAGLYRADTVRQPPRRFPGPNNQRLLHRHNGCRDLHDCRARRHANHGAAATGHRRKSVVVTSPGMQGRAVTNV